MSKKRIPHVKPPEKKLRPRRTRKTAFIVIALCMVAATGVALSRFEPARRTLGLSPSTAPTQATPANPTLAKEYIYADGRLVATEEPAATPVPTPTPCSLPANITLIISEFRLRGPQGAADEFIELYNNSDAPLSVCSSDGSSGWAAVSADGATRFIIPNGTLIPPRAHYLGANGGVSGSDSSYSMSSYALPDNDFIDASGPAPPQPPGDIELPAGQSAVWQNPDDVDVIDANSQDITDNTGLALFNTSDPGNRTLSNRLDAVGFTSTADGLYREGNGLTSIAAVDGEHSFVRKAVAATGAPQDSGNNAADFLLISTDAGAYGRTGAVGDPVNGPSILGAPGPEGLTSPVPRFIPAALVDPAVSSAYAPNRGRCGPCTGPNAAYGTMTIRRKFTNQTGQTITRLRFRVIDITTLNSPGYAPGGAQADLRELDSIDTTVTLSDGTSVPVKGTTLEGPSQPKGGGLSTSLLVTLPASGLPAGQSVNVQFVLGVQQGGNFRFMVLMEAIP
ncbi:MAG TPA: lamin tail domain-containing protein [Pyrinomonadaceae bacterium]